MHPLKPTRSQLSIIAALLGGFASAAPARQDQVINPHAPPEPDPALLQHPPTGPRPPASADAPDHPPRSKPFTPTKLDMAAAYMRFERATLAAEHTPDATARANREFDRATFAFFRGDRAAAIADLNIGTLRIRGWSDHPAAPVLPVVRVRVNPPVWTFFTQPAPSISIRTVSAARAAAPATLSVVLERLPDPSDPPDTEPVSVQLSVPEPDADGSINATLDLAPFAPTLKPGRYDLSLTALGGVKWPVGWWHVVSAPREAIREALSARLTAAAPGAPAGAVASARARLKLLSDHPSESSIAEFLADQYSLEGDLTREIATIERARNPYANKPGTTYRAFTSAGVNIPLWIHAPTTPAPDRPRPLVIALHGAGADESMFIYGYGDGLIRAIADRRDVIVASPLAYSFTLSSQVLDDLIATVSADYTVDASRIYLVGHSMGAIAATGLAQARASSIAGVVAIAGLRPLTPGTPSAPVLAFAAELDQIIPARRVTAIGESARDAGLPVEVRQVAGAGHTLVVGSVLPDAFDWMLARSLPARADARRAGPARGGASDAGK